ncbi:MAG: ATP-dependent DNA helicase RecG [Paenibacillaceae bacterium]
MSELHQLPIRSVKSIGPQKAKELETFGIVTVLDLLEYYPYRYEDYRIRSLTDVKNGDKVTVVGTIYSEPVLQMWGLKKSRLTSKVLIDHMLVTAVWFNRHYLKEQLQSGREIVLTGKWDQHRRQMTVSESEFVGSLGTKSGTLQPVYSVGGGITQGWMRKTIQQGLVQFGEQISEIIPESLIVKRNLLSRMKAIYAIHHPEETEIGKQARYTLIYEEFFLFQLKLQAFRAVTKKRADGIAQMIDIERVRTFVKSLPFKLTNSQKLVVAELLQDMQSIHGMNRLLQGDVGAGKTIVAAIGLFASWTAGLQGALMVPTEILAEQHTKSLDKLLSPYGIQVGLLTGSLGARARREMISSMQMGLIDIVVGTHALIQEDVFFRGLGLVVVDEQHRFGVQQRSVLRRKGMNPDVMTMTATPIPRTLAITAFGDMDVSTLSELPKGRIPIKTYSVRHGMMSRVIGFIRREAEEKRQSYVICPLIEESEKLDVQNAMDIYQQLQQLLEPTIHVGLLHGRMTAQEKDIVMFAYSTGELDVLVSTTVIEVGVDVPNATVMVIYDADRFGLSQLHQLRGRVGRGVHQSYCILVADPKSETAEERLQVMTETNDGFEISRRDLELRGPGDFFGTKQSGMPDFKAANILTDFQVLETARDDVALLLNQPDFWTGLHYSGLQSYLQREQVLDYESLD